jgi:3-oxoacyl-[acyl-carrier protein] reductase
MDFTNKIVLIAGGASGIGRAASLAFAGEGADVALTYLTSHAEAKEVVSDIEGKGRRALALSADLTDPSRVEAMVAEVEERLGPIDVLFANAGGLVRQSSFAEMSLDLWREVFTVNVESTFLTCKAVYVRMIPRRRGAIVTMASLAAFNGGRAGSGAYAAAKGAIVTFTRGLAKEAGPHGITVNCVAPGLIATRFHERFNTPAGRQAAVEATPVHREGTPADVAETVLFLASRRASFITGEVVQINGGVSMY